MKKLIAFSAAALLLLSLTACGANTAPPVVDLPMELPVIESAVPVVKDTVEIISTGESSEQAPETDTEPVVETPSESPEESVEPEIEAEENTDSVPDGEVTVTDLTEFRSMMAILLQDYVRSSTDTNAALVSLYFNNHCEGLDCSEALYFYIYGAAVYPIEGDGLPEELQTQLEDSYEVDPDLFLVTCETAEDGTATAVVVTAMVYENSAAAPGEADWIVDLAEVTG